VPGRLALRTALPHVNPPTDSLGADTAALIRERLAGLTPEAVELYDESGEHVGHAGARSGGGHYQLTIVSQQFQGQPRVARHRMVYAALAGLMGSRIHALAITAWTPEEFQSAFAR
jgi:BolA protein